MNKPFYKDGLRFTCTRCSNCCRNAPGYVFLSENDLDNLAEHAGMSQNDFLQMYCRIVHIHGINRLSLIEKKNFDCIFWEPDGCRVYSARPYQCRSYPFWPAIVSSRGEWDQEADHCPGIGTGKLYTSQEIEGFLRKRLEEPFINPV